MPNKLTNNEDEGVKMAKTIELDVLNKELSELQDAYSKEVVTEENLAKTLKTEQQNYENLNTRFHELEQQKIQYLEIAKQLADYLADFESEEQVEGIHNQSMHEHIASRLANGSNRSVDMQTADNIT